MATKEEFRKLVKIRAPEIDNLSSSEIQRMKNIINDRTMKYMMDLIEAQKYGFPTPLTSEFTVFSRSIGVIEHLSLRIYRRNESSYVLGADENEKFVIKYRLYFVRYPYPSDEEIYESEDLSYVIEALTGRTV